MATSIKYMNNTSSFTDVKKYRLKVYPRSQSSFSNTNQSIIFTLPNVDILSLSDLKFSCLAQATSTGTTTNLSFENGISDVLFHEIRVRINGTEIYRVDDSDLISSLLRRVYTDDIDEKSYHSVLEGYGQNKATRITRNAVPSRYVFSVGPIGSLLNRQGVLPLYNTGNLEIECYLNDSNKIVSGDAGIIPGYTLTDCHLICHMVQSPSLFAQTSGGFQIICDGYDSRISSEISTSRNQIDLTSSHRSLSKYIAVRIAEGTRNVATVDGKYDDFIDVSGTGLTITDLQISINGLRKWNEDIQSKEEIYNELVEAYPSITRSNWLTSAQYLSTRELVAINLQSDSSEYRSSITTSNNSNSLLLQVETNGTPASHRWHGFLVHEHLVRFQNGQLEIVK
jgi:hypothetical protein